MALVFRDVYIFYNEKNYIQGGRRMPALIALVGGLFIYLVLKYFE